VLSAWLGGRELGVLAALLAVLTVEWLITPPHLTALWPTDTSAFPPRREETGHSGCNGVVTTRELQAVTHAFSSGVAEVKRTRANPGVPVVASTTLP
jgi:hypothetical protein